MRKTVVVFGASGHAKVVLDILQRQDLYDVVGLLDNYKPAGADCGGFSVLGGLHHLPQLRLQYPRLGVVIAIGDNWTRGRVATDVKDLCPEIEFVMAIHPSAQIARDVTIGPGTVIMAGVVVNAGSRIGDLCILNTRASLDHDSQMEAFSSLGPAATTGGGVRIGPYSNIGIGATVLQEVSVGSHTVVGAAAMVFRSMPDLVVAYGTPARVIRPRKIGERYLGEAAAASSAK